MPGLCPYTCLRPSMPLSSGSSTAWRPLDSGSRALHSIDVKCRTGRSRLRRVFDIETNRFRGVCSIGACIGASNADKDAAVRFRFADRPRLAKNAQRGDERESENRFGEVRARSESRAWCPMRVPSSISHQC